MAATNINRVVLTGNLWKDPDSKALPSGTALCELRIACNTRRKNGQSGEWEDRPNFFNVKVFGAQATNCARYLGKGRPSVSTAVWSGASGRPRTAPSDRRSRSSPRTCSSSAPARPPRATRSSTTRSSSPYQLAWAPRQR